ncbi:MAG: CotH kinase family protein [Fibrobacterales bacterium]
MRYSKAFYYSLFIGVTFIIGCTRVNTPSTDALSSDMAPIGKGESSSDIDSLTAEAMSSNASMANEEQSRSSYGMVGSSIGGSRAHSPGAISSSQMESAHSSNVEFAPSTTMSSQEEGNSSVQRVTSSNEQSSNSNEQEEIDRPDGWTAETHEKSGTPNYEVVFPQEEVNRIDVTITAENWDAMMDDMTALYGAFGGSGGFGGPGGGGGGFSDEDPIFVPSTVAFDGLEWNYVGIRFKGNSTLSGAWKSGSYKIPLKLDFDEFESEYPEVKNQRFYGFKKLSLGSNYKDDSMMHEKVAGELFQQGGTPSPRAAFYRVYIDYGEGAKYFGLYTGIEVVDDTFLKDWFGSKSGNCYKPDGDGASFAEGSYTTEHFEKKTNEEEADWSDVETLYSVLHSSSRTSDLSTWKSHLESVLNVPAFLRWLAHNTVLNNWDTYGAMTHNYYLYNDPESNTLTWIPWDNNEAFTTGGRGAASAGTFDHSDQNESWPLIPYLLGDPDYYDVYTGFITDFRETAYTSDILSRITELESMIAPFVTGADAEQLGYTLLASTTSFSTGVSGFKSYVEKRISDTDAFLNSL